MGRILLADDSPHAQRMGDRILREEGYEVFCLPDGALAASRVGEIDPDLIIADAFLPGTDGYELCRYVKANYAYMRVVMTAGLLENLDESKARSAGSDGILRKPFEASKVVQMIRPLALEAQLAREIHQAETLVGAPPIPEYLPRPTGVDPAKVRAAVAMALEASLPGLIRDITEKVLIALGG